jgi:hypothetical protein
MVVLAYTQLYDGVSTLRYCITANLQSAKREREQVQLQQRHLAKLHSNISIVGDSFVLVHVHLNTIHHTSELNTQERQEQK